MDPWDVIYDDDEVFSNFLNFVKLDVVQSEVHGLVLPLGFKGRM
jgi:hypothetical protein